MRTLAITVLLLAANTNASTIMDDPNFQSACGHINDKGALNRCVRDEVFALRYVAAATSFGSDELWKCRQILGKNAPYTRQEICVKEMLRVKHQRWLKEKQ